MTKRSTLKLDFPTLAMESVKDIFTQDIQGQGNSNSSCQALKTNHTTTCWPRPLDQVRQEVTDTTYTWHQAAQFWAPSICLLVLILRHIIARHNRSTSKGDDQKVAKIESMTRLKVVTSLILSALSLVTTALDNESSSSSCLPPPPQPPPSRTEITTVSHVARAVLFGMAGVMAALERRQGSTGRSRPLLAFWTCMLVAASRTLYSRTAASTESPTNYGIGYDDLSDVIHFLGVLLVFSLSWFPEPPAPPTERPGGKPGHPEDSASWWGDMTLSWANGIIWTGFQRNLEESDLPRLRVKDRCSKVLPAVELAWRVEQYRCKLINESKDAPNLTNESDQEDSDDPVSNLSENNNSKVRDLKKEPVEQSSFVRALLSVHGFEYFLLQGIKCGLELDAFIDPLLTAALMNHIHNRDKEPVWNGVLIVAAMFIFKSAAEIAHHRVWLSICRQANVVQNVITMTIFKKALTVRNECKKDKTTGEIVNLISDDCDRVLQFGKHLHLLPMAPLKVCIALCLLHTYMGWAMAVGIVILLVFIPINCFIAKRMKDLNNQRSKVKDKRVKFMNEVINGIKVLKLYAWEKSFMEKVDKIRSEETDTCVTKSIYYAAIDGTFRAIPFLVKIGVFGTFILLGGHLDAIKAFVGANLLHDLNHPLSLMALLLPMYEEASISLTRITKFLNGEDISQDVVTRVSKGPSAVRVMNGRFSWERSSSNVTLRNVNMDVPTGGLVAVVGMVGSGKSSLLSSMLGEMERLEGEVEIQGKLAYVPQEAWVLNASLKDNVLFGARMEAARYREVVHGCCLEEDIGGMTAGDRTEIGEKGINLSGGQKQRLSLARAVYSDADVYLLDDPLSAVDAHVGKHIFNRVISHQGLLKGRTRVLVTHGIHWLPFVDSIIVMKDGKVSECGTYEQLLSTDGAFAQFLSDLCSRSTRDDDANLINLKQKIFYRLNSREGHQHEDVEKEKEEIKHLAEIESSDESGDEKCFEATPDGDTIVSEGKLIDDEETELGSVKKGIFLDYFQAFGLKYAAVLVCLFLLTIAGDYYSSYVIKAWADDPVLSNISMSHTQAARDRSWRHFLDYFISGLLEVVCAFLFICLTMRGAFIAGKVLHDRLLDTIMKFPMSFFDTTPSSRVVHRFSADVAKVDAFGHILRAFIEKTFTLLTSLTLIIVNAPVVLICLLPVCLIYFFLHRIHASGVCQIRRYKSKRTSPKYVHFSETLNGLSSIRAYACQSRFSQTMEKKIEEWSKFVIMERVFELWFGIRMSILYLLVQMAAGFVVVMDTRMTSGMAGLVLLMAGEFTSTLGHLVRLLSYIQTEVVALERVLDYTKKPIEAPWDIVDGADRTAIDWPSDGRVVFDEYKASYRQGLDLVLKGVNCQIKDGEKVGIVGRTGAGKSSLTAALFRLIEASSGSIRVGDESIAGLGLHDLRSQITILPQDPVIFAGSLRLNLDPFHKCTADDLWAALQHSHLKGFVERLPGQLDFECGEGGRNLSVGQRQLLCLARTLLRHTKILVLDEATAAVDMETDELIQKIIRDEFKECTVLTIAHRLHTIMDYDRILVLDQGLVKEFESPSKLLADKQSTFYSMAKDAKLVQ